jgi:hypothetical protein
MCSPRLGVVRGYLPAGMDNFSTREVQYRGNLSRILTRRTVPVKITSSRFSARRLLVDMFGVDYFSIDPTPFLTSTSWPFRHLLGDGVTVAAHRGGAAVAPVRFQEGLRSFFTLFLLRDQHGDLGATEPP